MKMIQCEFVRKTKTGEVHEVAWVDAAWKLKPGKQVLFDDDAAYFPERKWTVKFVGSIVMECADIHRTWRVGGL